MLYVNHHFKLEITTIDPYTVSPLEDVKLEYVHSVLKLNYFSRKKSAEQLKVSVRGLRNFIYLLRAKGHEIPNPRESSK